MQGGQNRSRFATCGRGRASIANVIANGGGKERGQRQQRYGPCHGPADDFGELRRIGNRSADETAWIRGISSFLASTRLQRGSEIVEKRLEVRTYNSQGRNKMCLETYDIERRTSPTLGEGGVCPNRWFSLIGGLTKTSQFGPPPARRAGNAGWPRAKPSLSQASPDATDPRAADVGGLGPRFPCATINYN